MKPESIVIIVGPTAAGKSEVAVRLAESIGGEIVNADSLQVYKEMEVGTAKPSAALRQRVPHHLIDLVSPDEDFTAADFRREAMQAIHDISGRGKKPIIVGGTGLYIRALVMGLAETPGGCETIRQELNLIADREGNPALHQRLMEVDAEAAARLHPNDRLRIVRALEVFLTSGRRLSEFQSEHGFPGSGIRHCTIGIHLDRAELYRRIEARVDVMIANGLVDEVRQLLLRGYTPEMKPLRSIGYKEICRFLSGEYEHEEAIRLIKRDTRHYAKRQLTWFRSDQSTLWVEYPLNFDSMCSYVMEFFG